MARKRQYDSHGTHGSSSHSLGYGTCWIGAFNEDAVKQLLKIPAKMKVVALLPIGLPAEKPAPKPRRELAEIFYKEEWQTPWPKH